MKKLFLVQLNIKYCEYLRNFDFRVPYIYDNKQKRPFIGVLFKVNE